MPIKIYTDKKHLQGKTILYDDIVRNIVGSCEHEPSRLDRI